VGYQGKLLEPATVKDVLKDLQENNIDVSQLMDWPKDYWQQAEHSTEVVGST
jgi:hypothetical protein